MGKFLNRISCFNEYNLAISLLFLISIDSSMHIKKIFLRFQSFLLVYETFTLEIKIVITFITLHKNILENFIRFLARMTKIVINFYKF